MFLTLRKRFAADSSWSTEPTSRPATVLVTRTTTPATSPVGAQYPGCRRHRRRPVRNIGTTSWIHARPQGVHRVRLGRTSGRHAGHCRPRLSGNSRNHTRKKPQGGELSTGDKANNRTISSLRSAVERCIAHLKNWKILATGYRGRLSELPNILRIIAALEFYRLDW